MSEAVANLSGLEKPSARVINAEGTSNVLLICEHASHYIPAAFANLGLSDSERLSHIGWDPGAAELAKKLSKQLDAPLVLQEYSRLLYDCNRPPEASSAMPQRSEYIDITGNIGLTEEEKKYRTESIYYPFHQAIDDIIQSHKADARAVVILTIHSFTPIYLGELREVELGVICTEDNEFSERFFQSATSLSDAAIRKNEPYGPSDPVLHTVSKHGQKASVMLEIRNDLLSNETDQQHWADLIENTLKITPCEEF